MDRIKDAADLLALAFVLIVAVVAVAAMALLPLPVESDAPHSPCATEDEYLRFDDVCVHVEDIKADRG